MSSNFRLGCRLAPLALAATLLPAAALAGGYNEAVSGDLSNIGTSPTSVTLSVGSNIITGATGNPGTGTDRDYFAFTLPAGWSLVSLTVLEGTIPLGTSFIGVQAGPQVTVSPTGGSAVGLLGFTLYSSNHVGMDILPFIGTEDQGSTGFTPPLGAGTYAFWIQEFGSGVSPYVFDFTVTAVPEPATTALWAAGLLGLLGLVGLKARRRSLA